MKMKIHIFTIFLFPALVLCQYVCIQSGICYQGSWINSGRTKFASFQGIRYALPPIKDLRFKPPQKYVEEEGTIDVREETKIICAQPLPNITGWSNQEDCLFINVYVPEKAINDPDIKMPVMFWIYGGSLLAGSGQFSKYGPVHFVNKDVIIVTINYRLGPFGFLTLGTNEVPGNIGLKDQNLALKWVNENIDNFGGDSESITIFGESAGALSVALHLTSPLSDGLFQRAIMQSDTAVGSAWAPISPQHALQFGQMLSKNVGCDEEKNVLECLQSRRVDEILDNAVLGGTNWMATSDIDFTSEPFIPGDPLELMVNGQFNHDIQVIAGTNADEGILYMIELLKDPSKWEIYRNLFDVLGPKSLFNIANESDITEADLENTYELVNYYVGSKDNINEEHKQGMFDMFTDASFQYGIHRGIKYLLEYGVTTYQYILSYKGDYSFSQIYGVDPIGVCHADDLIYLWDVDFVNGILSEEDDAVRELMTSLWTNFARNGDPTPPGSGLSWTPLEANSEHRFLNISGTDSYMTTSSKIQERMALWEKILG